MNNISVTVRNRLGAPYGSRQIKIWEDGQLLSEQVIPRRQEELPILDQNLQRIEIEAQDPQDEDYRENGTPIPITIDSPQNYVISTLNHEAENRWRIDFEAPQRPPELEGEAAPDPPPVNVTVGQDDPDWSVESRTAGILMAGSLLTAITLLLSEVSTYLGITIPSALGLGAAITWLIGRIRGQN